MREGTPTTPAIVFQSQQVLHFAFCASPVVYIIVGEIMRATSDDFAGQGLQDLSNSVAWLLRGALLAFALVAFTVTRTVFSDERYLSRAVAGTQVVEDMTIAGALQTAFILRLAVLEGIATFGLVLYFMSGDRIDYAYIGLGLLGVLLQRPSRDHWNAVYSRYAIEHGGVSSRPLG